MKIFLYCIGKPHSYAKDWILEYEKRLERFCSFEVVEIKESDKKRETDELILRLEKKKGFKVLLDLNGKQFTSKDFSLLLNKERMQKDIIFVIGGADGVEERIRNKFDLLLSFGVETLTHQMARLVLSEQIYRAFMIQKGMKYNH